MTEPARQPARAVLPMLTLVAAALAAPALAAPLIDDATQLATKSSGVSILGVYVRARFHCRVEAGPKLAGCTPEAPLGLNPVEASALTAWVEASPACLIPRASVGAAVVRTVNHREGEKLDGTPHYTMPDWVNPAVSHGGATPRNVHGSAVVRCSIDTHGIPFACTIVKEAPAGKGVGAAALGVSRFLRFRPETRDCVATDEGKANIPINIG